MSIDTKQKGDIAEQAAVLHALNMGWAVLHPVGDRLPYDLVFDVNGVLIKIQVKSAWLDEGSGNYRVESRRTKTNRRQTKIERYEGSDFDFALLYIDDVDVFYVLPIEVFNSYKGAIALVEVDKRQRKPRSSAYRDAWSLIEEFAEVRHT